MAYKYTQGSVRRGDIYNEDDTQSNTYLDWSEDAIGVIAGGSTVFVVSGSTAQVGIGTTSPVSTFEVSGSQGGNYTQAAGSITFTETHFVVDYTGNGDATFTLPAPSGVTGRVYYVVSHAQGATDALTVTSSGDATTFQGPNVEGGSQANVAIDGNTPQSLHLISTGADWFILHDGRSAH